jgi:hypothetical protein
MPKKSDRLPLYNGDKVLKSTQAIRLEKMKASLEATKQAKALTITLREFIKQQYVNDNTAVSEYLKVTIKDIGLHPYEVDVYDCRMIVVKVIPDRFVKNESDELVPYRKYIGRHYGMNEVLNCIRHHIKSDALMATGKGVVTIPDVINAYFAFEKYLASMVHPEYAAALTALQKNLNFTRISVEPTDEEDWFKSGE